MASTLELLSGFLFVGAKETTRADKYSRSGIFTYKYLHQDDKSGDEHDRTAHTHAPIVSFGIRLIGICLTFYLFIPWLIFKWEWYTRTIDILENILRRFIVYPLQTLSILAWLTITILPRALYWWATGAKRIHYPPGYKASKNPLRFFILGPWDWSEKDRDRAFDLLAFFDFCLFFVVISIFSFGMHVALWGSHYLFFFLVIGEGFWRLSALIWQLGVLLEKNSDSSVEKYFTDDGVLMEHFKQGEAKPVTFDLQRWYQKINIWVSFICNFTACGAVFAVVCVNMTNVLLDWSMPVDFGHLAWWGPEMFMTASFALVALMTYKLIQNIRMGIFCYNQNPNSALVNQYKTAAINNFNSLVLNVFVLLVMLSAKFPTIASLFVVGGVSVGYPLCAAALITGIFNWAVSQWVQPKSMVADALIKGLFALSCSISALIIMAAIGISFAALASPVSLPALAVLFLFATTAAVLFTTIVSFGKTYTPSTNAAVEGAVATNTAIKEKGLGIDEVFGQGPEQQQQYSGKAFAPPSASSDNDATLVTKVRTASGSPLGAPTEESTLVQSSAQQPQEPTPSAPVAVPNPQ